MALRARQMFANLIRHTEKINHTSQNTKICLQQKMRLDHPRISSHRLRLALHRN
jgi:hypothetical protein